MNYTCIRVKTTVFSVKAGLKQALVLDTAQTATGLFANVPGVCLITDWNGLAV